MRASRRRKNLRGPSARPNRDSDEYTITNPDMTKNRSTPAAPSRKFRNGPGSPPMCVTFSVAACSVSTPSAATARSTWMDFSVGEPPSLIPPTADSAKHHLDQIRPFDGKAARDRLVEIVHCVDALAGHTHAAREADEIEIGARQIEHVERLAADILRADVCELVAQDRVGPVVEDHGGDIEVLARLRPQRLDRVHRRAIGF